MGFNMPRNNCECNCDQEKQSLLSLVEELKEIEKENKELKNRLKEANNTIKMYEEKILDLNMKLDKQHKLLFGE